MKDIKPIIAKNIAMLRQTSGMTQLEFSEKLNYSDKAVSKWERGESIPDVSTLVQIAELFGVTLNYLTEEVHPIPPAAESTSPKNPNKKRNRMVITGIAILFVWLIATFCFVVLDISIGGVYYHWLAFVCAVPASMVVWLIFNCLWFDRHRNYLIISLLMWAALGALYVVCLPFGYNLWLIFLVGIPAQAVILVWSRLKYKSE